MRDRASRNNLHRRDQMPKAPPSDAERAQVRCWCRSLQALHETLAGFRAFGLSSWSSPRAVITFSGAQRECGSWMAGHRRSSHLLVVCMFPVLGAVTGMFSRETSRRAPGNGLTSTSTYALRPTSSSRSICAVRQAAMLDCAGFDGSELRRMVRTFDRLAATPEDASCPSACSAARPYG